MRLTEKDSEKLLVDKITVDTLELQKLLSCGHSAAVEIGTAAGARVKVGRRVLWNVQKIKDHINLVSA